MQERKSLHAVEEAFEDGGGERCSFEGNVPSNESPPESRSALWESADKSQPTGQDRGAWLLLRPYCLAPALPLSAHVCSGSTALGRADTARSNKNSKLPAQ